MIMDPESLPSSSDLPGIAAYLELDTELPSMKADIAFMFGTRHPEPAHIAAGLYRRGIVGWIVATGGVNRHTGLNEARSHESLLLQAGVPHDRLVVEERSTNTFENAVHAVRLLETVPALREMTSIVVVAKWYHSRRAVMTLKRVMPCSVRYFVAAYAPPDVPRQGWQLMASSRAAVLKEWERIPQYLQRGHLAEIACEGGAYV
jgi:uncharacterized SAM-binding protein YcdF (DUF218 family)